jgi:ankyrin repeat protein
MPNWVEVLNCLQSDNSQLLLWLLVNGLDSDLIFPQAPNDDIQNHPFLHELPFLQFSPPCLSIAAYCNSESCFRLLISRGADVNRLDNRSQSPACYAASQGSLSILNILAFCNASFDGALQSAAESPNSSAFLWLYTMTDQVLGHNPTTSETILHSAARGGDPRIISLLLKTPEIDVNATTEFVCHFPQKVLL